MKGLYKTAPGDGNVQLRDAPIPRAGTEDVVIEVKAAGICGSDLHIYRWDIAVPMRPPMIMGHEFSGVITAVGEGVVGWNVGDRVTAEPSAIVCGVCRYCRTGSYNLCPQRRVMGYWVDGVFAEYVRVPSFRLHRLPAGVSFEEAALTEPLACCVHGVVELTEIKEGDTVVVSGPGAIGLLSVQLAVAAGARVIVVGTSADTKRFELAAAFGAEATIDVRITDAVAAVRDLTDGYGADVVLECSGAPAAAAMGIELVRKQGSYTQIGLFGKPITIDFERIAYKELRVTGSLAQRWTAWKRAIAIMEQGRVKLAPIISDVVALEDWKSAFERFERKEGYKILFDPKK